MKQKKRGGEGENEHAFRATALGRDWTEDGLRSKNHLFGLWNLVAVHFKDNVTSERELVVCSSGAEALSEF